MDSLKRKKGRPVGGTNHVLVSLSQLKENVTDGCLIPVSVKFARALGLAQEQKEVSKPKVVVLDNF